MLLNVSPIYVYENGKEPLLVSKLHRPYFVAFVQKDKNIEKERSALIDRRKNTQPDSPLSMISEIGEIESYNSFANLNQKIEVFKVYTDRPGQVPAISDYLFQEGFFTAEHDIPYQQRALIDLSAFKDVWMFDTHGRKEELVCLSYDIETFQYEEDRMNVPIDILGYSSFSFGINSKKDLGNEDFSFELLDFPTNLEDREVVQLIARNEDEEIDNLSEFCKVIQKSDIIAGHNLLSFDNQHVWERIKWLLRDRGVSLSGLQRTIFKDFLDRYSYPSSSYYFGRPERTVVFYPTSFDTYHAARKFYRFLNDYSLKSLAPFLGIKIKDRIYLQPSQLKLDERTLKYNEQDVQEDMGVTGVLLQQALPLAFTTSMPFEDLLPTGAVHLWDHMALLRGTYHRKLMPALCRAYDVAGEISKKGMRGLSRKEIAQRVRVEGVEGVSKDFRRVVKYGEEMPEWVEYPEVIYGKTGGEGEMLGYHIPGGMTLKPDTDLSSHFVPWYKVVVADVGAMYPTILRAVNAGADSIGLAKPGEEPQDWVWLKRLSPDFLNANHSRWREVDSTDEFADKGVMVGIKKSSEPGLVNLAMGAIMKLIDKIKAELKSPEGQADKEAYQRLKQMYQSLKGARNAGTHGILCAPMVTSRQFNLWGAAYITTQGQKILGDALKTLSANKIRVVYGDSVDAGTDIIIREGKLVKIVNIKDLFESCDSEIYRKGDHEYKAPEKIECLSVSKEGICEWKKANSIKRHPYEGKILNIQTRRGSISVTKNHSLYALSSGLKEILCRDLNKNTPLAHISKYSQAEKKLKINALEPLRKFSNELNIWLSVPINDLTKRLLKYHQPRNNFKGGRCKKEFIRIPIPTAIELYNKKVIEDKDIQNAFISSYGGKGKIPVIYELNKDFARILGAYAAEGSLHIRKRKGISKEGAHIFACGHDIQSLEELKKILARIFRRNFNVTCSGVDKNGRNFRIKSNSAVAYLFKFVLDVGQGSQGKEVSPYILSSSKSIQRAFFDEYTKGEGYCDKRRRVNPLLECTTKSKKLAEGLSLMAININCGLPSIRFRKENSSYQLRFVQYDLNSVKYRDLSGLLPKEIKEVKPTDGYVYDVGVEGNNNFVCAKGLILAHNTDGIYVGCSRSANNLPAFARCLDIKSSPSDKFWLSEPSKANEIIEQCNEKWRRELNYPGFGLESEAHDAMIFVKHKNYLIFDEEDGKFSMSTKGNNFKGSDKPNIARKALEKIMKKVLKENLQWEDEASARESVKQSIRRITRQLISELDFSDLDIEDLTLVQSVQPSRRYKPNPNGSISVFGARANALERVIGTPIKTATKFKFVVTKKPLPGITHPTKSGVKPIDYMYPIDHLEDRSEIDLRWYKEMVENFIKGAFGLEGVNRGVQRGLADWM